MEPITENLFAHHIGTEILKYLTQTHKLDHLVQGTESAAIQVLSEIQSVLDDETLDDPTCFRRIDAIVDAFHRHGLSTTRHDF